MFDVRLRYLVGRMSLMVLVTAMEKDTENSETRMDQIIFRHQPHVP